MSVLLNSKEAALNQEFQNNCTSNANHVSLLIFEKAEFNSFLLLYKIPISTNLLVLLGAAKLFSQHYSHFAWKRKVL